MALYNPKPGIGSVVEYQVGGIPAIGVVSAGEVVTFTSVTKAITLWGIGAGRCWVQFATDGDVVRFVNQGKPARMEIRTKELVGAPGTSDVYFVAELTNISAENQPPWTDANNDTFVIVE